MQQIDSFGVMKKISKTAKFPILEYILDDNLIIYKSHGRLKKIKAFYIIETSDYQNLIPTLNKFLINGLVNYYSIQINISLIKDTTFNIILNVEDDYTEINNNLRRILKIFEIIKANRDKGFILGVVVKW